MMKTMIIAAALALGMGVAGAQAATYYQPNTYQSYQQQQVDSLNRMQNGTNWGFAGGNG